MINYESTNQTGFQRIILYENIDKNDNSKTERYKVDEDDLMKWQ